MIRPAQHKDASAIADIYNHYIETTFITFEEETVSANTIKERMGDLESGYPWFVHENEDGEITGYAYGSSWHRRSAYCYTAETSIYLRPDQSGKGIGTTLYRRLLEGLKEFGVHVAIGGAALPNPASVALHEKLGFEKAAHYKAIGWKMGRWIDVVYWQIQLNEGKPEAGLGRLHSQSS